MIKFHAVCRAATASGLLLLYLVFVARLTLTPQPIGSSDQGRILRLLEGLHRHGFAESIDYDRLQYLANIGLFVPIGMLLLLLFGAGGWWAAAIVSFAMTCGIELGQQHIPGRVSDANDVVANTAGALIGVGLALLLTMPATLRRGPRREQPARR